MFSDYPLEARVLKALEAKGFTSPTPIQANSLPHTLEGKDVLGQARTGTGKTLAFGLPIAHNFMKNSRRGRAPRALIVTPTRELALQVSSELNWLAPELSIVSVYGGTGYGKQQAELRRGCDVVVATPGRALDYLKQRILDLSNIEIAVLDEADEMLSMGFEKDVETLLAATPKTRQTLFFSATLPRWAKNLANEHLHEPVHINLIKEEAVSYEEVAIEAPIKNRLGILSDVLHAHFGAKTIIFTHTKLETDDLAQNLSAKGHTAAAIHGDLNQSQRERVLKQFRHGQINTLIGTNVAARGLDIPKVDLVVHYRIPHESEAYQHRSGRTGRAGRQGTVVLLYSNRERRDLQQLERAVSRKFKKASPPNPETIQEAKLSNLMANAKAQSKVDKAQWHSVAETLIQDNDHETLAGLLVLILGGAPSSRSLLTGEEDWLTLELKGRFKTVAQVVRHLKDHGAGDLGRIQLTSFGAYADIRPKQEKSLVGESGIKQAKELQRKTIRTQPSPKSDTRSRSKRPTRRPSRSSRRSRGNFRYS